MNYVARDQYGNTFFIDSDHPRKWLLDHFGRRSAQKMYIGEGEHIGWIIAGHWLRVWKIQNLE